MAKYIITESQWKAAYVPLMEQVDRIRDMMGIKESVTLLLNEIDYENKFSDVQYRCATPEEVLDHLNGELSKKQALDQEIPVIPKAFRKRMTQEGKGMIDINKFIKEITKPPIHIWGQNRKMQKSSGADKLFVDMGLPAVQGVVYDIEKKQFNYVTTCVGAGSCKTFCYALNGFYIMYEHTIMNTTRLLNYLLNYPEQFEQMLEREARELCQANAEKNIYLRWHDSGDFFTKAYMEMAKVLTERLRADGFKVISFAYTKNADAYKYLSSDYFIVGFSTDATEAQWEKFSSEEKKELKQSITVPRSVTSDLFVRQGAHNKKNEKGHWIMVDPSGEALKNRISHHYDVDKDSLLLNRELSDVQPKEGVVWNVIVPPGENDHSAVRKDVRKSFLLMH